MRSTVGRIALPVALCVLVSSVALPKRSHAKKTPAYLTYKSGQKANKAFRSLTRRYRPLRKTYRANKAKHAVGKSMGTGVGSMAGISVPIGYMGMVTHFAPQYVQATMDAASRGNTGETIFAGLITTMVVGFGAGNAWLGRAFFRAGKQRFADARLQRNYARRDTLKTLLGDPGLQRRVNKGQLLPQTEVSALRTMVNALPKPPASYKPRGRTPGAIAP